MITNISQKNPLFIVFLILFIASCDKHKINEIKEGTTLNLIERKVNSLTKDDLVVFDVDDVLITASSAIHNRHKENRKIFNSVYGKNSRFDQLPEERKELLSSIWRKSEKMILVDEQTPNLIKNMQDKGIKVIALTALPSGKFGIIEKREDWRIEQLKKVGIDFSTSFALEKPLSLCLNQEPKKQCLAKKGIIFTGKSGKGEALECFLNTINWRPKRIVFIDNDRYRVESVAARCKAMNIEFLGLVYTKVAQMNNPANEEIAQTQLDYLIDHEQWLDDAVVKNMLAK